MIKQFFPIQIVANNKKTDLEGEEKTVTKVIIITEGTYEKAKADDSFIQFKLKYVSTVPIIIITIIMIGEKRMPKIITWTATFSLGL